MRKLTDAEKSELLCCVRYSYLDHRELLTIFNDPVLIPGKTYVHDLANNIRRSSKACLRDWDSTKATPRIKL